MPAAVRKGDPGTHGGSVTSTSGKVIIVGMGAAYVGSRIVGEGHGTQTIITGSGKVLIEGKPAVRDGDTATCGAKVRATQAKVIIN